MSLKIHQLVPLSTKLPGASRKCLLLLFTSKSSILRPLLCPRRKPRKCFAAVQIAAKISNRHQIHLSPRHRSPFMAKLSSIHLAWSGLWSELGGIDYHNHKYRIGKKKNSPSNVVDSPRQGAKNHLRTVNQRRLYLRNPTRT